MVTELVGVIGLKARSWPTGDAFLAAYTPTGPGCLVLDIRMPGMSGLQLQKELTQRDASCRSFTLPDTQTCAWRWRR